MGKLGVLMVSVSKISECFESAIRESEFSVYFQPQYNHSTGDLIGAEALVRWISPELGFVSPADFVPVLEAEGRIPTLDLYVFEQVCKFLRGCIDNNRTLVRISVNMSRNDILCDGYIERLDGLRKKYDIPNNLIHVELTETAAVSGAQVVIDSINKLHDLGFIVEMDDFGSGYSSLNVLKDMNFDVLKLDLKFIAGAIGNERGGTILSSVVRMAKWLKLPVIAEGVETMEQADFLKSVGCDYIQGYLYSRPLPEDEYVKVLDQSSAGSIHPQMNLMDTLNAAKFWNPESFETLIFSKLAGPASIMDYHDGFVETLRVNQKFLRELDHNMSEAEVIGRSPVDGMDEDSKRLFQETFEKAIQTKEEQECETWCTLRFDKADKKRVCIRCSIQLIGESKVSRMFYVMIRNVTLEATLLQEKREWDKRDM